MKITQTFPGCMSNCDQGRKLCPCPTVCEKSEDFDDGLNAAHGIIVAVILMLAFWAVIALALIGAKTL